MPSHAASPGQDPLAEWVPQTPVFARIQIPGSHPVIMRSPSDFLSSWEPQTQGPPGPCHTHTPVSARTLEGGVRERPALSKEGPDTPGPALTLGPTRG